MFLWRYKAIREVLNSNVKLYQIYKKDLKQSFLVANKHIRNLISEKILSLDNLVIGINEYKTNLKI